MSQRAFVGSAERSFGEALIHLLETEYGLLNSRKVLVQLVADVANRCWGRHWACRPR